MTNKLHKFIEKVEGGYWIVSCVKTGGEFNTKCWAREQVSRQTCPCCNNIVEDERRKKR